MKLKCGFEIVDMGDEVIAVPVGDGAKDVQGILKLDASGREIFEMLTAGSDEEQIVRALDAKYDNGTEALAGYVRKVLRELRAAGLTEE